MLPRSKWLRVSLLVVPLVLIALLWKAARQRPRFVATPAPTASLALSHDGKRLAIATTDNRILWWENGKFHVLPAETSPTNTGRTPTLQFSRDRRTLVGTDIFLFRSNILLAYAWNLETNKINWSADAAHKEDVGILTASLDGRKIVRQFRDNFEVLDITDASAPRVRSQSRYTRTFPITHRLQVQISCGDGCTTSPAKVALSADNQTLILTERGGILQFWDISTGQRVSRTSPIPGFKPSVLLEFSVLSASPDGRYVALCDGLGVNVWDRKMNRWTQGPQTTPTEHYVAWMPDSRSLWLGSNVSTGEDKNLTRQLSVPDLKTMRVLPEWGPLALSGDGHTLATGTSSSTPSHVRLWPID